MTTREIESLRQDLIRRCPEVQVSVASRDGKWAIEGRIDGIVVVGITHIYLSTAKLEFLRAYQKAFAAGILKQHA